VESEAGEMREEPNITPSIELQLTCVLMLLQPIQVVITKLDSGNSGAAVQGVHVVASGGPPMISKLKKQGTSKLHNFKPSVSLQQAIEWSVWKTL
jgi:hypothetical protein